MSSHRRHFLRTYSAVGKRRPPGATTLCSHSLLGLTSPFPVAAVCQAVTGLPFVLQKMTRDCCFWLPAVTWVLLLVTMGESHLSFLPALSWHLMWAMRQRWRQPEAGTNMALNMALRAMQGSALHFPGSGVNSSPPGQGAARQGLQQRSSRLSGLKTVRQWGCPLLESEHPTAAAGVGWLLLGVPTYQTHLLPVSAFTMECPKIKVGTCKDCIQSGPGCAWCKKPVGPCSPPYPQ